MSELHPYVAERVKNEYWHHRSKWMEGLLTNIDSFFKETLGASHPILAVTGTYPAGCEALAENTVAPGDCVWATPGSSFEAPLRQRGARVIVFQPGKELPEEEPTSVYLGKIKGTTEIAKRIRRRFPRTHILADVTELFGKIHIDFKKTAVDGYVIAPEKLSGVPGFSVLALNVRVHALIERKRAHMTDRPYTFDLIKYAASWQKFSTPYSPDISACVAFDAAIRIIRKNGGFDAFVKNKRYQKWISLPAPASESIPSSVFTMQPGLFITEAARNASQKDVSPAYEARIVGDARRVFSYPRDYRYHNCFADRTVGFIGAGNVVKEALWRCRELGIKHVMVYTPALARQKRLPQRALGARNHKSAAYWEERGAEVARSPREVFLKAHTVILLPTYHTNESVGLLNKGAEYRNEKIVSAALLNEVERKGRMDVLINSSAREGLVDRAALAKHLKRNWLSYFSDELPPGDDSLLSFKNAVFTGHVGGSCPPTQKKVASNTRLILREVLRSLKNGAALAQKTTEGYRINLLNEHLNATKQWRIRAIHSKDLRVLLTDRFDTETLDFHSLEKELGINITVHDISSAKTDDQALVRILKKIRPHVVMVRTRTKLSDAVAEAAEAMPEFSAVIRPGVGIDNVYGALRRLSHAGVTVINEPCGNSYAVAEMTMHFILHAVERAMLTPGPTHYQPYIFAAVDEYRGANAPQFIKAERDVRQMLQPWMGLGEPLVLSIPSTGFMEAAITNLTSPGDHGLVISHGKFGTRFADIAASRGRSVDALIKKDSKWGTAFSPKEIGVLLKKSPRKISFLCMQQNETSSGVAYRQRHIERIVKVARRHNSDIIVIVDAVSGLFAHALDFKKADVDTVILGSQKGLGLSSGLSFIALSSRAERELLRRAGYKGSMAQFEKDPQRFSYAERFGTVQKVHYLNLLRLIAEKGGVRTDVSSVFHVLSARRSLLLMQKEGGKRVVVNRHRALAELTRKSLSGTGMKVLTDPSYVSDSVTPILMPTKKAPEIRRDLERYYGILVAGAQIDYWKPRVVRIGHLGYVNRRDIVRCMRALRLLSKK